jgi:diacylglycerol kinase (ATP)
MSTSGERVEIGWLQARAQSFRFALRGLVHLFAESNTKIHGVVALGVLALSWAAGLSAGEWALMVFAITLVLATEALNTALEHLADAAVPQQHPLVGTAKDVAASAVLIVALGAAAVGALVLGPHRWALVRAA